MYNSDNGEPEPGWVRDEEKIYLLRHDKDGDELLNLVSLLTYIIYDISFQFIIMTNFKF